MSLDLSRQPVKGVFFTAISLPAALGVWLLVHNLFALDYASSSLVVTICFSFFFFGNTLLLPEELHGRQPLSGIVNALWGLFLVPLGLLLISALGSGETMIALYIPWIWFPITLVVIGYFGGWTLDEIPQPRAGIAYGTATFVGTLAFLAVLIVARETEAEARETVEEIIYKADVEAVKGFGDAVKQAGQSTGDKRGMWRDSDFKDFQEEVDYFGREVLPIVRSLETERGLVAVA